MAFTVLGSVCAPHTTQDSGVVSEPILEPHLTACFLGPLVALLMLFLVLQETGAKTGFIGKTRKGARESWDSC